MKLIKGDAMRPTKIPNISIVIPTFNEERIIKKCLESLYSMNYPRDKFEIIIVDDGSNDKTKDIIKQYDVELIETSGVGPSEARNIGLKKARGEFIAFTDGDCIVHKEWLNELLKGFVEDNVVGVGGKQKSPRDDSDFGKNVQYFLQKMGFICDYTKSGGGVSKAEHSPTCNVMYHRSVLEKLGGFEKGLWPGEDVELDYRIKKMGYELMNNSNAVVYHYRPDNFQGFAKMMYNYGRVQAYLVKKYGFFRLLHYVPVVALVAGCLWLGLLVYTPFAAILLAGTVFLAFFLFFLLKTGFKITKALNCYALFLMTLWKWNLGFFKEILRG